MLKRIATSLSAATAVFSLFMCGMTVQACRTASAKKATAVQAAALTPVTPDAGSAVDDTPHVTAEQVCKNPPSVCIALLCECKDIAIQAVEERDACLAREAKARAPKQTRPL